jgi:hypothetical protein
MNHKDFLIDLIGKIEEKRLICGKNFYNILKKHYQNLLSIFLNFSGSKNFLFYIGFLAISISLIFSSTIDIGALSGLNLDIAHKLFLDKKNLEEFYVQDSILFYALLLPAIFTASIFKISPIIFSQYYINILAILSIYLSYKILKKSKIFSQSNLNIVITTYIVAFFFRFENQSLNDFITKNSFILICFYPYLSLFLAEITNCKKSYKFFYGLMSAIIIILDFYYLILIILFEIYRIYQQKRINKIFQINNYILLIFITFYNLIIYCFFNQYFANNFGQIISIKGFESNVNSKNNLNIFANFIDYFSHNLINFLALILVFLLKNPLSIILKKIHILIFATFLILLFDNNFSDKLTFFYAIALIYLSINFLIYQNIYQISFKKYWILIIAIFVFSCLAHDINELSINFLLFIFSFIMLYLLIINNKLSSNNNLIIKLASIAIIFSLYLLFYKDFLYKELVIYWLFSVIFLLIFYVFLNDKSERKQIIINYFVISIFIIYISNFSRIIIISLNKNIESLKIYLNENQHNQNIFIIANNLINNHGKILILSNDLNVAYPIKNYLKLENNIEFSFVDFLKNNSKNNTNYDNLNEKKLLDIFLKKLTKNNNVILIYDNNYCSISNLEFLIRNNVNIKNYIINNYKYLGSYSILKEDFEYKYNYTFENLNFHEKNIIDDINKFKKTQFKHEIAEFYIKI